MPVKEIVLKSQLYGKAADLSSDLSNDSLKSADGMTLICNAVYHRDIRSEISEPYKGFHKLLNTKRNDKE